MPLNHFLQILDPTLAHKCPKKSAEVWKFRAFGIWTSKVFIVLRKNGQLIHMICKVVSYQGLLTYYFQGPDKEGCSCETTEFGCCPDDVTAADGPDFAGCGCMTSEHGCCPDNFTPANGTHHQGCTCHTFEYGCCPDGKAIARGPGHVSANGCVNFLLLMEGQ